MQRARLTIQPGTAMKSGVITAFLLFYPASALAQDEPETASYQLKLNTGTSIGGQLRLDEVQKLIDYPVFFTAERIEAFESKLGKYDQYWSLGIVAQYSNAAYQAGEVLRRGYHRAFGLRASYLLNQDAWLFHGSLDILPSTMISVFSTIQSSVNGSVIKSESQTDLTGYGIRLGQAINYRFSYELFSSEHLFVVGVGVSLLMETYNKRRDLVIRSNFMNNSREVSDEVQSCSCSARQAEITIQLGYEI